MGVFVTPSAQAVGSDLDGPVTTDRFEKHAEYDPMPGRLGKLPASYLFRESFTASGAHRFRIMTICPTDGDTGIIVHDQASNRTFYNDNGDPVDQHAVGSNGTGSFVDAGARETSNTYVVYVFSKRRATSFCRIRYSTNGSSWINYEGNDWRWMAVTVPRSSSGFYREFGGTLVKTGPLRPGDFLEVQTAPGASPAHATHMALFQISAAAPNTTGTSVDGAPTYAGRQSQSDIDPRINVDKETRFLADNNYVIVGKVENFAGKPPQNDPLSVVSRVSKQDVEVFVDLIRGPLDEGLVGSPGSYPALACSNGACVGEWRTLPMGRYYAWIYAKTAKPVGHISRTDNAASAYGTHRMRANGGIWFETTHEGPSTYEENGGCYGEFDKNAKFGWRGVPNQNALKLHVEYKTGVNSVVTRATRAIPLGAFGGRDGDGWNLFMMELRIDSPNAATFAFRLRTSDHANVGLTFFPEWRYRRNIDASEMKLVSWNAWFKHDQYDNAKFKNAADLFATRGTVWNIGDPARATTVPATFPPTFRVEERADQAPFQWDADIVGLQEVRKFGDNPAGFSHFDRAEIFETEAASRSSMGWSFVRSKGEQYDYPCGFGYLSTCYGGPLNPLFFNTHVRPQSGPYFSAAAKKATHVVNGSAVKNCDDMGGHASAASCHLAGDRSGDIPGMKGDGDEGCLGDGAGYSDCYDLSNYAAAGKAAARRYSGTPTVTSADRPLAVFNVHLEYNYPDSDDRYMEVKSLIDIVKSMMAKEPQAFNNSRSRDPFHYQNRFVILGDTNISSHACGEHYVLTRLLREHFGYAVDVAMAAPGSIEKNLAMHDRGVYNPNSLLPVPFRSFASWLDMPDAQQFAQTEYPFWSRTFRGKTSKEFTNTLDGERHDIIWLVGRGWAYDDPVLSYKVMSDSTRVTPMNPSGRGVEMWAGTDGDAGGGINDGSQGSVRDGSPLGYAPNYSLTGRQRGKPALHSDHRPVGARVRIFTR